MQRDREIMESALATTEEVLMSAGAYDDDGAFGSGDTDAEALLTPRSRRDIHRLHHHHAAEGHRHCAVCDEIKNGRQKALSKRSRKIPAFQEKGSGLGGGARRGKVSSSTPGLLRTPQRRRKAAWETTSSASGASGGGVAVAAAAGSSQNVLSPSAESVTQSQHITVELSAAIKLLEQTLSQ